MAAGLPCCAAIGALYVGLLYVWRGRPRNHPGTIRRRMASVAATCLLSWLPAYLLAASRCARPSHPAHHRLSLAPHLEDQSPAGVMHLLGLRADGLLAAVTLPLCLTATLFAGPLLLLALDISDFDHVRFWPPSSLQAARDYLFAPITEEWAFRACMIPALCLDSWSASRAVLLTPLFFGAAHLHHVHEAVVYQGCRLADALAVMGFQMAYTTVFGWYAAWLLVRTGHVAAPIVAHAFCNFMGFPSFGRMLGHRHRNPLLVSLVLGVVLFAVSICPLTDPTLYAWNTDSWAHPCTDPAMFIAP
mmetsp:Transcript_43564/g.111380  ORF Transcript_43564/g.111380 Transcript_43564/m.111380 type:complete len:303 (+) Transcript_43564:80-988(+)|eukprot:jgi/Tetstr1/431167/TSEL_020879.t1